MTTPKLNGSEPIKGLNTSIHEFWQWAYSDILSNRNRAIFAEFIVAKALDITDTPRQEWSSIDLTYKNITIEVKTGAYLQSWYQDSHSTIRFDISPKKHWNPENGKYTSQQQRNSDVYIFCLFKAKENGNELIRDMANWEFYIVKTSVINERFENQKTVSFAKIHGLCKAVGIDGVKGVLDGNYNFLS